MPILVSTVDVPEPFRSAQTGDLARAADAKAPTPEALFGRAMVRIAIGREADARADLETAMSALGDPCRIELAFLDIRQRSAVKGAAVQARLVADRAERDGNTVLLARALHIIGLAQGKMRHTSLAVDSLLRSRDVYGSLGDRLGASQVYDTLGMVEGARGQLDHAMNFYALSLVDKTMLGDSQGMAITLGNLGRIHLRAGRFQDAISCFERDLAIAHELQDSRGQARMHEDLGRAYLGLENLDKADRELTACLSMASQRGFADLVFFARKDMARVRIAQGRLRDAEDELRAASDALPDGGEKYFRLILLAVRGELLLARRSKHALDVLQEAVDGFEEADLPDLEILTRLWLARALMACKCPGRAEQCLLQGLRRARRNGYARHIPSLNEAMADLDLVEGIVDETNRPIGRSKSAPPGSYIIRRKLGEGAFGEVFRAYDPERARDVALKRLRLKDLYEVRTRKRILASARAELESASRVRHPGVVRVLAIGREEHGGSYVVQEFVDGSSLRSLMPNDNRASVDRMLPCLAAIADALQALHEARVTHRDLKPENILVRADGSPVLVDFGLAHVAAGRRRQDKRLVGTLLYMAPEQAMRKRVTARADLYSLGVIAYEWLAGLVPIQPRGKTIEAMARDLATRKPPTLSDFRPGIGKPLERLVMSLLAKRPSRRPTSASVVAEQLRSLLSDLPSSSPSPSEPEPSG